MTGLLLPLLAALAGFTAWKKGVNLQESFTSGALEGLRTLLRIFPALLFLLPAVEVLRASGLLTALTELFSPLFSLLGIPKELAPILVLRPLSGSGALAAGTELMAHYGPDSPIGRKAAVLLGSTETTFYVLSVYFGALGRAPDRRILPCALLADLAGFILASLTVRLYFGA